jgi:protein ImuB
MLWVALHFQPLPQGTLEAIGAWACQFTPSVSLEPPRELLLEVQGSVRLFGGVGALKERIHCGLEDMGFSAQLATAATARAALWFSRSSETTLHAVPVQAACGDADALSFLDTIGICTVGQLMRLPREGLAQRCGARLLADLDRALGTVPEPRAFFQPPPRFCAKLELPAPVAHAEGLAFAARRLLVQLEGLLAARQAGIRAFHLVLIDDENETRVEAGLASPAREADRMTRLAHEKLSLMSLARPVEAIRVEADSFVPLHARTAGMFGDEAAEAEDWAQLAERLRSRLGHDAVFGLATHPDHRPEHAWRRVEPGEWDPREYRAPGPRPLWLVEARKIKEGEFTPLAGPERIESGWWDGDEARRDYFVARLPDESLGWVYREQGEWFLHGLFA